MNENHLSVDDVKTLWDTRSEDIMYQVDVTGLSTETQTELHELQEAYRELLIDQLD